MKENSFKFEKMMINEGSCFDDCEIRIKLSMIHICILKVKVLTKSNWVNLSDDSEVRIIIKHSSDLYI